MWSSELRLQIHTGSSVLDAYVADHGGGHASSPLIYPGCAMTYTIPKTNAFVGGDLRLLIVTSLGSSNSLGLFASGGIRF